MSTLKIWETVGSKSGLPLVRIDERTNYQTVTFTGTRGTSVAFDSETSVIAVVADVACAVSIGGAPLAAITDYPVLASTITHFDVQPGQKISVIAT